MGINMAGPKSRPPKGKAWLKQVFGKDILKLPEGLVVRKVTSVERYASEAELRRAVKDAGLALTRFGTHYMIHRRGVVPVNLI